MQYFLISLHYHPQISLLVTPRQIIKFKFVLEAYHIWDWHALSNTNIQNATKFSKSIHLMLEQINNETIADNQKKLN